MTKCSLLLAQARPHNVLHFLVAYMYSLLAQTGCGSGAWLSLNACATLHALLHFLTSIVHFEFVFDMIPSWKCRQQQNGNQLSGGEGLHVRGPKGATRNARAVPTLSLHTTVVRRAASQWVHKMNFYYTKVGNKLAYGNMYLGSKVANSNFVECVISFSPFSFHQIPD